MSRLAPKLAASEARALLDIFTRHPEEVHRPFVNVLRRYHQDTYMKMLDANDDQLAGYRGMLIAIHGLIESCEISSLQNVIEKAKT